MLDFFNIFKEEKVYNAKKHSNAQNGKVYN